MVVRAINVIIMLALPPGLGNQTGTWAKVTEFTIEQDDSFGIALALEQIVSLNCLEKNGER